MLHKLFKNIIGESIEKAKEELHDEMNKLKSEMMELVNDRAKLVKEIDNEKARYMLEVLLFSIGHLRSGNLDHSVYIAVSDLKLKKMNEEITYDASYNHFNFIQDIYDTDGDLERLKSLLGIVEQVSDEMIDTREESVFARVEDVMNRCYVSKEELSDLIKEPDNLRKIISAMKEWQLYGTAGFTDKSDGE